MMNKIKLLLFSIVSFANMMKAQTNSEAITNKNNKTYTSYISFDLLSPLDVSHQRWRLGYSKHIKDKWRIGIDFGYGNKNITAFDHGNKKRNTYQLWEIRPEIAYLLDTSKNNQKYISLELFYINHNDAFHNTNYIEDTTNNSIHYDTADFHRAKYGFLAKYGVIFNSKKRFGVNVYSGIGLRIRKNTYSNIINPATRDNERDFLSFLNYRKLEGTAIGLNFSMSVKLLYKL